MAPMHDLSLSDSSQVGGARRLAASLASEAGFSEVRAGAAALVATELCTNLLKHAGGGRLLLGLRDDALQLLALDQGRGMADVGACLADGYSTAGTPGNGLGAVQRQSQAFHLASWPQLGSAVYARVQRDDTAPQPLAELLGVAMVAKAGELACGDAWDIFEDGAGRTALVVDGLGHGTEAAIAAHEAVAAFQRQRSGSPTEIIEAIHGAIRHTRGAAVAVARMHWASATTVFAGLGNIAGTVIAANGQMRRMVSHNGTAGHNARKIQSFEYPSGDGLLVMHSDGIGTSWSLDRYPGLARQHPMLVAGVLYRDFARGRDDATVLVTRINRNPRP